MNGYVTKLYINDWDDIGFDYELSDNNIIINADM
jgi:hypothetical protein